MPAPKTPNLDTEPILDILDIKRKAIQACGVVHLAAVLGDAFRLGAGVGDLWSFGTIMHLLSIASWALYAHSFENPTFKDRTKEIILYVHVVRCGMGSHAIPSILLGCMSTLTILDFK